MKRHVNIAAVLTATLAIQCAPMLLADSKSVDELGQTLTLFGAEMAGNSDGTIPPYTGGIPVDTAPAGWVKGSGRYEQGPFSGEKPLFTITASNVDEHRERLTAGVVELFKKYPDYRMDVYPTHRSVAWPEESLAHCKSNAVNTKLTESGNGFTGAHACAPFPIPQNGMEVQWNIQTRRMGGDYGFEALFSNTLVTSEGRPIDPGHVRVKESHPYHDVSTDKMTDGYTIKRVMTWVGPPSQVGTSMLQWFPADFDKNGQKSWSYSPGQRRTRVAPEFAFDTPVASYGGANLYDEMYGWDGSPERFDWTLVGKKDVYIPYNNNKLYYASVDDITGASKKFINPDLMRWELHRVWVVEATLKKGMRHSYPRRTFYVDEDSWFVSASDGYDHGGTLQRVGLFPLMPLWDVKGVTGGHMFNDLSKGYYILGSMFSRPGDYMKVVDNPMSPYDFTSQALTRTGVR